MNQIEKRFTNFNYQPPGTQRRILLHRGLMLLDGVYAFLTEHDEIRGKSYVAKPSEFVEVSPEIKYNHEPTMVLGAEALQRLMDDLWNMGFRPANQKHQSGEIDAMKSHLDDMRELVFFHTWGKK